MPCRGDISDLVFRHWGWYIYVSVLERISAFVVQTYRFEKPAKAISIQKSLPKEKLICKKMQERPGARVSKRMRSEMGKNKGYHLTS